jgi:hypothetical protein
MRQSADDMDFPRGPGPASVMLSSIGIVLFFLPILGGPLSAVGLLLGAAGLLMAATGRGANLLWSLAGLGIGSVGLTLNLALAFAPLMPEPPSPSRSMRQAAADPAAVSPKVHGGAR